MTERKCTPDNFAERYTGDMTRDYEMLTASEWLEIYGDEECSDDN